MSARFTSLNNSQRKSLHNIIKNNYENCSSSEIENIYSTLKQRYDELKIFSDRNMENNSNRKQLSSDLQAANRKVNMERSRGLKNTNFFTALKKSFSGDAVFSKEHENAISEVKKIQEKFASNFIAVDSKELEERKRIYHQLKVLGEIRKEHKIERTKSLANLKVGIVRAASSTLKRREVSKSEGAENCPYCDKLFSVELMVLDHIYPVAEGGLDTMRNTVLVCSGCNTRKTDLTLRAFARKYSLNYENLCLRLERKGKQP